MQFVAHNLCGFDLGLEAGSREANKSNLEISLASALMKTKVYKELEFTISPLFPEHVKPFIMCEPLFSNNFRMVDRFLTHGPLLTI